MVSRAIRPSVLLTALLSCAYPRASLAALPPVAVESAPAAAAAADSAQQPETMWALLPPVQLGGRLSYELRRDTSDYGSSSYQGLTTTLTAKVNAPVWQPWFGQLSGAIDFSAIRSNIQDDNNLYSANRSGANSVNSKNIVVTGKAQLSLLPLSKFPFEAHFDRSDSRTAGTLSALDGYTSQRLGLSQNYQWSQGSVMFGWDRNSQTSATADGYQQNVLQMALSQNFGPNQTIRLNGHGTRNTRENSDEFSEQNALYAQHSFRSGDVFNVQSTADISRSRYRLALAGQSQANSNTRQVQLNSYGIWRPQDQPLTVNGGVRMLTLTNSFASTGLNGNSSSVLMRNVNLNGGAAYYLTKALQLTGSANVNLNSGGGLQNTSGSQMGGVSYVPDPIAFGNYQYAWTGNSTLTNRSGELNSGQQLLGQLSHNLNRSIEISQGSTLSAQLSQSVSSTQDTSLGSSRQLAHSGFLAWSAMQDSSMTLLQLNASDARSWGTNPSVFQLLNLQATGNLTSSRFSSWTGSLTIQSIRQSYGLVLDPSRPDSVMMVNTGDKFVTTSSGSLSYQNQRAFGVQRLRFISELRLNSQALLPMLGGPLDQETASWENRLEYAIGRTYLRFNTRISNIAGRTNKAILVTLTRDIGDV